MTVFATMMTDHGLPVLTELLGTSVTYTEPDSDDVALTAILGEIAIPDEFDADGNRIADRQRSIVVGKDSTATYSGLATVNIRHGRFTIADLAWSILEVESETESSWRLRLGRPTAIAVSRPGLYQGK